jgi:hypothetical protein
LTTKQVFLLGAGFNAEASAEAGPIFGDSMYTGRHQIDCAYPLGSDALRECFNLRDTPAGESLEALFSQAIERGDYAPLDILAQRLIKADHYLGFNLARSRPNCYRHFFESFPNGQFLTFNYDCLVEALLSQMGRWCPQHGFGVAVEVVVSTPKRQNRLDQESTALVLHLHGSLYIRTSEYHFVREHDAELSWLQERKRPLFSFDPYSNGFLFGPFGRNPGDFDVRDRIIAPVLNKSDALQRKFVSAMYKRARDLIRNCQKVVAIGYSFRDHDRQSYCPILDALDESGNGKLIVIAPDAERLVSKIRPGFPRLRITPIVATLKEWSGRGFSLD